MPSVKIITPILGGKYYHIFNRGINKQPIFFQERNFSYLRDLFQKHLDPYVDFLAYSFMPNHFHLVIWIKDQIVLPVHSGADQDGQQLETDEELIGKVVSNQLRRIFITFSMAINKQEKRTGSLFEKNFRRLNVLNEDYLKYVIFYVHYNPEKHRVAVHFKDYRYSSYWTIPSTGKTIIDRSHVFDLYGSRDDFLNYHSIQHAEREQLFL